MPREIRFWLEAVSLSDSERENIDPIDYGDVSEKEQ